MLELINLQVYTKNYAAALVISKAFDKVDIYMLYSSLIKANVSCHVKMFVTVNLNCQYSQLIAVEIGVRQGSVFFQYLLCSWIVLLRNLN